MKSSEPLNLFANLINSNRGTGIAVLQSSQLTRLVANCILNNGQGGVTVGKDSRVELRGNGIYKNGGHGVSFNGNGQIVENDVVGNRGYGIQIAGCADIKVREFEALTKHVLLFTTMCISSNEILAQHLCSFLSYLIIFLFSYFATASNQHRAVALLC